MDVTTGGCGCGAIQYSFTGKPINVVFCYCKQCQIHTGSDKWFGAWVSKDRFEIVKGTPSIYTRKGDSGHDLNYIFCSKCGVTVCTEVTVGNLYSVAVSTFAEQCDLAPTMVLYAASAPKWAVFPEGVPQLDVLSAKDGTVIKKKPSTLVANGLEA